MRLSIALFSTLLAIFLSACMTNTPTLAEAATPPALILAELQRSADAWNAGDLKSHLSIYDQSVTVMTKTGPRPTIEAIEESFTAAYFRDGKPTQTLSFSSAVVRMLSPDSALATGQFTLSGGGKPDQSGWFTLVWVRTPAGWRAVHDHTS